MSPAGPFPWLEPFADVLARKPERIEVVLLDAGNTLAHIDYRRIADLADPPEDPERVRRAELHARHELSLRLGPKIAAGEVDRLETIEVVSVYMGCIMDRVGYPEEKRPALIARFVEANHARPLWRVRAEGDEAALQRLKDAGCRLAVVSNSDGRVEKKLHDIGLAHWFETIIDSKVVGVEKPDPKIFDIALERLGNPPRERIAHVGDLVLADVLGAARAGITPILLDPIRAHRDAGFAGACANDLGEVADLVAGRA